MEIQFFGRRLQSPLIVGSGPLSYGADGIIALHRSGAGAVVTKTIRNEPAVNPEPHIAPLSRQSMINSEQWSDFGGERWAEEELPRALEAGARIIVSIGHTPEEAEKLIPVMERAGAPMFELVSYNGETMVPMVRAAKERTDKPVLVKISPNWENPVKTALDALENGADGITAMDSLGPVLSVDIRTARASVAGENGMGWLTGAAIKPLALRYVAEIAMRTEKPVIGLGGVMGAEDALEMVMAGASAVGVCTLPMLKGPEILGKLDRELDRLLHELGYSSLEAAKGAALPNLVSASGAQPKRLVYSGPCRMCGLCVKRCPYNALSQNGGTIAVEPMLCRRCGLCAASCPENKLELVRDGA